MSRTRVLVTPGIFWMFFLFGLTAFVLKVLGHIEIGYFWIFAVMFFPMAVGLSILAASGLVFVIMSVLLFLLEFRGRR